MDSPRDLIEECLPNIRTIGYATPCLSKEYSRQFPTRLTFEYVGFSGGATSQGNEWVWINLDGFDNRRRMIPEGEGINERAKRAFLELIFSIGKEPIWDDQGVKSS